MSVRWGVGAVVLLLVYCGTLSATAAKPDDLDRAIARREERQAAEIASWAEMVGMSASRLRAIRHVNERKSLGECPSVGEIERVDIQNTVDTKTPVITLQGVSGKVCSLWLTPRPPDKDEEGEVAWTNPDTEYRAFDVRSVTSY